MISIPEEYSASQPGSVDTPEMENTPKVKRIIIKDVEKTARILTNDRTLPRTSKMINRQPITSDTASVTADVANISHASHYEQSPSVSSSYRERSLSLPKSYANKPHLQSESSLSPAVASPASCQPSYPSFPPPSYTPRLNGQLAASSHIETVSNYSLSYGSAGV